MVSIEFSDFKFYRINPEYLEYLHTFDSEVYYDASYKENMKPFIGILIGIEDYKYFIPLTSPKAKHKKWSNVADEHILIYEIANIDTYVKGHYYKPYNTKEKLHLIGVLDIKKMIPVPRDVFKVINFSDCSREYRSLLEKEYEFCLSRQKEIVRSVNNLYNKYLNGVNVKFSCNYKLLEKVCQNYIDKEIDLDL